MFVEQLITEKGIFHINVKYCHGCNFKFDKKSYLSENAEDGVSTRSSNLILKNRFLSGNECAPVGIWHPRV